MKLWSFGSSEKVQRDIIWAISVIISAGCLLYVLYKLMHGKPINLGFRLGPTQTDLYSHKTRLEA